MDTMTKDDTTPRVWVGCLACYNAGRLVGEWFDGLEAGSVGVELVHQLHYPAGRLAGPELQAHEELWVMDHEGYGGLLSGECSPAEAQELAELLDSLGVNADAFAAYVDIVGEVEFARENFEEAFAGEYESERDYAEDLAEDVYRVGTRAGYDDIAARYFDYGAFARDLFMSDYFSAPAPGGGVFVFSVL